MKKLLYLFLIFTLIFCSSESSVEPLEIDNFQEEEYEESEEEEEYEESEEWDKGTTYYDTSSTSSTGWYMGQGTDREEHVHEGMQTFDGGYIAVGHHWEKEEDPTGFTDMIILKTDSNGNELWQTIIGTPDKFDVGYAVNAVSYTHLTLPTSDLV